MTRPELRIVENSKVDFDKVLTDGERQQCERWVDGHPQWRDWQAAVQQEGNTHTPYFFMLLYAERVAITRETLAKQRDPEMGL